LYFALYTSTLPKAFLQHSTCAPSIIQGLYALQDGKKNVLVHIILCTLNAAASISTHFIQSKQMRSSVRKGGRNNIQLGTVMTFSTILWGFSLFFGPRDCTV